MNFLAHFHLSHDATPEVLGSLLGDFVKGKDYRNFDDDIAIAILLHRKIDSFTDIHPLFYASKQRLKPELRRFGGIIVDLFYDHFLARHWSYFSETELELFTQKIYSQLDSIDFPVPQRCDRTIKHMCLNNWLDSYQELSGISRALEGISMRLSRHNALEKAVDCLQNNYSSFEQDFLNFYPILCDYAASQKQQLRERYTIKPQ